MVVVEEENELVPLRSWIKSEAKRDQQANDIILNKKLIVCQATVAYGIVELILRAKRHAAANKRPLEEEVRIENFAVCVVKNNSNSTLRPWDDIKGVSMLSPGMSISIEEPSYLSCLMEDDEENDGQTIEGRNLEVELISWHQENSTTTISSNATGKTESVEENKHYLSLLAKLLFKLFFVEQLSEDAPRIEEDYSEKPGSKLDRHPRKKLMLSRAQVDFDQPNSTRQDPRVLRMRKSGLPASLCLMIEHLFECDLEGCGQPSDDAYTSLEDVAEDLHLLLLDPERFLFDQAMQDNAAANVMQLNYRKEKVYGRDKQESQITDAFCRVSRGTSEAILIGGFSGSGKSMLVDGLRTKVDAVGGYVIKYKFDDINQMKPLTGVISALNQLCQIIKDRSSAAGLAKIAKQLREDFGVDINLLIRLLPSVSILSHDFFSPPTSPGSPTDNAGEQMDTQDTQSVEYTLIRFLRVVSSPHHPVMLFLDDLQWADGSALGVIHSLLSDTRGSCMLFVDTYRDNEVQADHAIFDLIKKLESSNVQTTKVALTGLDREDLNTMISDSLCLYPRICRSLSICVFDKTKGNPFFVLEFMQSLVGRGLLQYNIHTKRWVWNEAAIRSEECMGNVLHLLSSKMNNLSDDVQTVLKVMACFGSSTNESVIDNLSKSSEYSNIQDSLKIAIRDGFIVKGQKGNFKFVHDKVREAAYNLIPDIEKKEFHYKLGIIMNSNCEGGDIGNTIFLIASQINYGEEYTLKSRELRIKVGKLNMKAGKRALDGYNHKTAYSFLETASSLLPEDHWESCYELSLRLSILTARAAYSCRHCDAAESILLRIFEKALATKDKLPAYSLLGTMYQTEGKVEDAFNIYLDILTQLGETILVPDSVTTETSTSIVTETLNMCGEIFNDEWNQTTMDESLCFIPKFYCDLTLSAFFCKPRPYIAYISCKAVQLCLQNGMCHSAPLSFMNFTVLALSRDNVPLLYRIGSGAVSFLERFNITDRICDCYYPFYAGLAWKVEPFQLCADKLIQAFSSGLSNGNPNVGMYCLLQANYMYTFCGKNLRSLLVEIDYYLNFLKSYKSEVAKNYFLANRETVSTLIDKGLETGIELKPSFGDMSNPLNKQREMFFFHQAIRCFWLGYTERFKHFAKKCLEMFGHLIQFNTSQIKFYHGLYLVETQKKKKSKETLRLAVADMRDAVALSEWNFMNKLELLEAELYSFDKKSNQAIASYDASIASARNSRFTHEQGLACEKAGFHCKREKDRGRAMVYFQQARECYEEWGSRVKVDFIQKEIDQLNN